jgi:hypothetical protein
MSLNNYKKIRINSGGERVLYFDGSGASGTLFPAFADTFDVRINQDDLTNRDLLVTDDTTARVDVQGLNGEPIIRIDLKVYSYQLLDEIEDDGGTDADEDYSHSVYDSLSGYSLACSCSQSKTSVLYAGTGSFPAEDYQIVFTDGDKIITGIETETGVWNLIPPKTSRIEIKPFVTAVKLPVRAKDIANDDKKLTAVYDRLGTSIASTGGETLIEDQLVAVYDTDNDYKIEIGYRTAVTPVPQIFLDDTAKGSSGANSLQIEYDGIDLTSLSDGSYSLDPTKVQHDLNTEEQVVELSSFASNQNDYNIGRGTVFTIQTSATPSADITGITGGTDGRIIHLINRGNTDIIFRHDDSNSAAANRFYFTGSSDPLIEQWQTISLRYVAGSINRWIRQS